MLRKELHDSLTLCNWVWPLAASPLKSRGYEGDVSLEAQFYSAVTGRRGRTRAELDLVAERIFALHRALTIRDMKTADMRRRARHGPVVGVRHASRQGAIHAGPLADGPRGHRAREGPLLRPAGVGPGHRRPDAQRRSKRLGLKDVADKLAATGLLPADSTTSREASRPTVGVDHSGVAQTSRLALEARPELSEGRPASPSSRTWRFAPHLALAGDPARTIVEVVRRESAVYPRPTPLASFADEPYRWSDREIADAVQRLAADPDCEDIRPLTASDGSRFLFSSRHLDAAVAASRAEWMAVGRPANP